MSWAHHLLIHHKTSYPNRWPRWSRSTCQSQWRTTKRGRLAIRRRGAKRPNTTSAGLELGNPQTTADRVFATILEYHDHFGLKTYLFAYKSTNGYSTVATTSSGPGMVFLHDHVDLSLNIFWHVTWEKVGSRYFDAFCWNGTDEKV